MENQNSLTNSQVQNASSQITRKLDLTIIDTCILDVIENHFTYHVTETKYGYSITIMRVDGRCCVRFYVYVDDRDACYIENLSVDKESREKGLGNELLEKCEKIARLLNKPNLILFCESGTFVREWYERNGFEYVKQHETERDCVWLNKSLI